MTLYRFNVSQECIDLGARGECHACPVALSMIEAGMARVYAGLYTIRFIDRKGIKRRVLTPEMARRFMNGFDRGAPQHPFVLELQA